MTPQKIDHPPLLDGGVHPFTLEEFRELTVDRFPESARRPMLFAQLEVYLQLLSGTGIKARLWLDGSYLTLKSEPDDIDLVVVFERASVNAMPTLARQQTSMLLNTRVVASRFKLHVFQVPSDQQGNLDYWLKLFGTLRDEITPKGIAELRVNL